MRNGGKAKTGQRTGLGKEGEKQKGNWRMEDEEDRTISGKEIRKSR